MMWKAVAPKQSSQAHCPLKLAHRRLRRDDYVGGAGPVSELDPW